MHFQKICSYIQYIVYDFSLKPGYTCTSSLLDLRGMYIPNILTNAHTIIKYTVLVINPNIMQYPYVLVNSKIHRRSTSRHIKSQPLSPNVWSYFEAQCIVIL